MQINLLYTPSNFLRDKHCMINDIEKQSVHLILLNQLR